MCIINKSVSGLDEPFAIHWIEYLIESLCVAVCCSVFQYVAVCFGVVALCCTLLQCVAVCCRVLQCVAIHGIEYLVESLCVAVCCSVLQCVAVCCSALQVHRYIYV